MSEFNAVVAVYAAHQSAQQAIKSLNQAGTNIATLSVIVQNPNNFQELPRAWGQFWTNLLGTAHFVVPGMGLVLMTGPIVGWIISNPFEGADHFGGLSAIGVGLYGKGFPEEFVLQYEADLKSHRFLLIVNAQPGAAAWAAETLDKTQHLSLSTHTIYDYSQELVVN
jgi:hypothetical protein